MAGLLLAPFWLLMPRGWPADVFFMAVLSLASVATGCILVRAPRATRSAARLVAAAAVLTTLGWLIFFSLQAAGQDPDGSVADVYYVAGYLALAAAVFTLLMPLRGPRRVLDLDALIDILTVVAVCLLVMWELVVRDSVLSPGTISWGFPLLYPLIDAVLIGLTLRAMTDRYARTVLSPLFGLGLGLWLVGDFSYLGNLPALEDVASMVWMTGALLVVAGTLPLVRARPAPTTAGPGQTSGSMRLVLAIAPLCVPPLLVVVETLTGRDPESWSLVVGITVLIALAFVRTERLLASERRTRRELATTRDAALEASHAKSTFLAAISHEIRTPMNGVVGLSTLLGSTELDEEQRGYVDGIGRAGDALMVLLNDVLDFAKLEDGRVQVDRTDFDLVTVVEDVGAMVAEQAHGNGVELVVHCAPGLAGGLEGDPTKVRQVLLNLASNAVAFTTRGEVEIRAVPLHGDVVRFEVRDTGPGIAAEDQVRLFDAFTQVGHQPLGRRAYGGTGLGLAIAKSLVEAMDGTIGVDSAPARGSTFWCEIPLGPARQQHMVQTRPSRARPGAPVLVVDDNATSRGVLADQLRRWDLRVDVASDAAEALTTLVGAAAAGTPYLLAVVDLEMPGTDGLALAEQIHRHPGLRDLPLIALTAGPAVPTSSLQHAGVQVRVSKPVGVTRLQGAVQRALGSTPLTQCPDEAEVAMGRGVVLVADDSTVNQIIARGTLRQLGYLAEIATNGAEAVAMVAAHHYDAVLMDCRMPVTDGYQAATEIRRQEQGRRIPIIALTADGDPTRCLASGMDDFLLKPLGRQQLADALARWVPADRSR